MRRPIEYPCRRWPRLRREPDWVPRPGERVRFWPGDDLPFETVRIHQLDSAPGQHLIVWRRGTVHPVSANRLYPFSGWRERHAREDLERADSTGSGEALDPVV